MGELTVINSNAEVLAPGEGLVYVTVQDIWGKKYETVPFAPGTTLGEMVAELVPMHGTRNRALVHIEGDLVYEQFWKSVRPKPETTVSIQVLPGGGGGKGGSGSIFNILGAIAMAVAMFLPGPWSFVAIGVGIAIGLLGQILTPKPKTPKIQDMSGTQQEDSPTQFISGTQNDTRLYSVVPRLLGRHLVTPPYALKPFTEIQGNDQYVTVALAIGLGTYKIESEQLGTTLLSNFQEVQTEFRRGYLPSQITDKGAWDASTGSYPVAGVFGDRYTVSVAGTVDTVAYAVGDTITYNVLANIGTKEAWDYNQDKPFKLYPQVVDEQGLQVQLTQPLKVPGAEDGWQLRTTGDGATKIGIDISFLQGLTVINASGGKVNRTVDVEIQYALAGTNAWSASITLSTTAHQSSAVRNTTSWVVPTGTYDVRLRRKTQDTTSTQTLDLVWWTALRAFKPGTPIARQGVCTQILRIKATDQLNGVVDNYNCVATSILLDYDNVSDSWIWRPTQYPPSMYLEVFTGIGLDRLALPQSRLDLDNLKDWHTNWCVPNGYKFNLVVDFNGSVSDLLDDICTAGRAAKAYLPSGKWGVLIDRPQGAPVHKYTERNIWDVSWKKPFAKVPTSLLCRFINEDQNWAQDLREVQADNFDPNNPVYQNVDFPGVTDPDIIYKLCRFLLAQAQLRQIAYIWSCDMEYLIGPRGSLVTFQHTVLLAGLGAGRITELVKDGGNNIVAIRMDESMFMELGKTYAIGIDAESNPDMSFPIVTNTIEHHLLTLVTPILSTDNQPEVGDIITFGETGLVDREVLVFDTQPQSQEVCTVTAYDYAPAIYTADTEPIPEFQSKLSFASGLEYPAIVNVRSDESVLVIMPDQSWYAVINITLSTTGHVSVTGIEIRYRLSGNNNNTWQYISASAAASTVLITNVTQDEVYDIQARYTTANQPGPWGPVVTHTVIGAKTPPADITHIYPENGKAKWADYVPPRDIRGYYVKYLTGDNFNWDAGIVASTSPYITTTEFDLGSLPFGTVTLMVKAVDLAYNESVNPIALILDLGDPIVTNVLTTIDVDGLGFPGTQTNCHISAGDLIADVLSSDDYLPVNTDAYLPNDADPYLPDTYYDMSYEYTFFSDPALPPATLIIDTTIAGSYNILYAVVDQIAYATPDGSLYADPDGDPYAPSTTGAIMFQPWPGQLTISGGQVLILHIDVAGGANRGEITNLDLILDGDDESESIFNFTIAASGTVTLPLTKNYYQVTNVNFTVLNATSAITVTVDHPIDPVNPVVRAYNTGGRILATVNVDVEGIKGA